MKTLKNPKYKTDTSMDANTVMEKIQAGRRIYNEIDAVGGRNVNYHEREIIPYTWDDFTNLVMYEKANELSHNYSAMIAINLMKGQIKNKSLKFLDGSEDYKQQCVGETAERIHEFYDELYLDFVKKIETWDVSCGVYFDQYVKWDIREVAEYVGNFDVYGTGKSVRNEVQEKVAFQYSDHVLEPIRKSPTQYAHDFQYTPPMAYRPLDEQYIFKHEQRNDPDNIYLRIEAVRDYVRRVNKKIDASPYRDLSCLMIKEKNALAAAVSCILAYDKAIENALPPKEQRKLEKKLEIALDKAEAAIEEMSIVPPPTPPDRKLTNQQAASYLYMKQGLSNSEIAEKMNTTESNVICYIRAAKRYIEKMAMETANIAPDKALWYLAVTGTLSTSTVDIFTRLGCKSIEDAAAIDGNILNHFRSWSTEKAERFIEVCKMYDITPKCFKTKEIPSSKTKNSSRAKPARKPMPTLEKEDNFDLEL